MDQVNVSPTSGRYARLALILLAAVFGLLLLTFAFGSSSASADDGGSDDGGLVPAAADLVGETVATVKTVATAAQTAVATPLADIPSTPAPATVAPVAQTAPAVTISETVSSAVDGALVKVLGQTIVGEALGTAPVGSVLVPVAKVIDSAVSAIGDLVAPAVDVVPGLTPGMVPALARASADAMAASIVSAGAAALSGTADGAWPGATRPFGLDPPGTSGVSLTTMALPAAALGAAFFVLLWSRRLGVVNSTLPVSPVYETDTSPD